MDEFFSLTKKMPIDSRHICFDIEIGFNNCNSEYKTHKLLALVDTGAEISAINKCLACKLGMIKIDSGKGLGSAGTYSIGIYNIDVILEDTKIFRDVKISEIYEGLSCDFIIGMDILKQGDVAITNMDREMVFSFRIPHNEKIIHFGREQKQKELNICYYCGHSLTV
jgi:predicted aspartyl protease